MKARGHVFRLLSAAMVLGGVMGLASALCATEPGVVLKRHAWIDVDDAVSEDVEMAHFLKPYMEALQRSHGQVLVHVSMDMRRGGPEQHNQVGYWVADVMREAARRLTGKNVRLAFINSGGLRGDIPAGPMTYGKLCEVMPFDNELVVAQYTGAQIIRFVKQAVRARGGEPCSGLHIQLKGPLKKPELILRWEDGSSIDPKARVWVAITDYLLASGDKSPGVRKVQNVHYTGRRLRDLMKEAAQRLSEGGQTLHADPVRRVEIDPVFYGRIRDYQPLF